jgi:hypothetical protein
MGCRASNAATSQAKVFAKPPEESKPLLALITISGKLDKLLANNSTSDALSKEIKCHKPSNRRDSSLDHQASRTVKIKTKNDLQTDNSSDANNKINKKDDDDPDVRPILESRIALENGNNIGTKKSLALPTDFFNLSVDKTSNKESFSPKSQAQNLLSPQSRFRIHTKPIQQFTSFAEYKDRLESIQQRIRSPSKNANILSGLSPKRQIKSMKRGFSQIIADQSSSLSNENPKNSQQQLNQGESVMKNPFNNDSIQKRSAHLPSIPQETGKSNFFIKQKSRASESPKSRKNIRHQNLLESPNQFEDIKNVEINQDMESPVNSISKNNKVCLQTREFMPDSNPSKWISGSRQASQTLPGLRIENLLDCCEESSSSNDSLIEEFLAPRS